MQYTVGEDYAAAGASTANAVAEVWKAYIDKDKRKMELDSAGKPTGGSSGSSGGMGFDINTYMPFIIGGAVLLIGGAVLLRK